MDGRWWVVMKRCVSDVCENDRFIYLVAAVRQTLPFPAYIFLSLFLPPLSPRVWVIDNFDMADVSDTKIQEGSFHNYTQQIPAM